MPTNWHNINEPAFYLRPTPKGDEQATGKGEDDSTAGSPAQTARKPEIRFVSAQFEPHPVHGYAMNKPCVVRGKAEFLQETLMTKCSLKLLAVLNDQEHDLQIHPDKEGTAYIDKTTGEFTFDNVTLYIPAEYPERETFKTPIRYKGVVSSSRCESPIEFFLDLPAEGVGQAPVLKRGMYDDKGVENYPSKFHKGGDGYVEGAPVFEFQRIMERFHYLPRGGADGVFGPNTEKAAKQFQTDSLDTPRVKESGGKLGQASRITYSDTVDGIVGPKTREEVAVWQREGYLRPLPDLYHDDYDREAVKRGLKSNRRGNDRDAYARRQADNDDYHDTGTPVLNAQQTLQKMDAYDGVLDGWFFDRMKEAVKLFQSCAEKGEFLVNGVLTDIGEKLTGHQSGVLDIRTQEFMGKVGEVGGKVPANRKSVKKGDKGKIVEEINIRLAGFGGGVPSDTFDDVTEKKVRNFQRIYMEMEEPTGVLDVTTAKAIDDFADKQQLSLSDFRCSCGECGGFGKQRFKGEYRAGREDERFHKYEYPGIHRSLLWLLRGFSYHLSGQKHLKLKIGDISSGYRCWIDNEKKKRTSTNHMGKAADLHIYTADARDNWRRGGKKECDQAREVLRKECNCQVRWGSEDRFALEPSDAKYEGEFVATTWVHVDVRTFQPHKYLLDKFFVKNGAGVEGTRMQDMVGGEI